jgi:hypothetical protein
VGWQCTTRTYRGRRALALDHQMFLESFCDWNMTNSRFVDFLEIIPSRGGTLVRRAGQLPRMQMIKGRRDQSGRVFFFPRGSTVLEGPWPPHV